MNPDTATLLFFDIDATLLVTGGAGLRAMVKAGEDVFGPRMRWEGIEMSGGLDPVLVYAAAEQSGIPMGPEDHDTFRRRYVAVLEDQLERSSHLVRTLPGVLALLENLRKEPDLVLGLLTGNYQDSAALKLRTVGIDPGWFSVSVYGDEGKTRVELVAAGIRKSESFLGRPIDPGRIVIVGDTPRDVEGALRNGCRALAVATGRYSADELRAAGAHAVVKDLADPGPLLSMLSAKPRHASGVGTCSPWQS